MGCDIHLHIEIKLNGKWEHLGNPNIDRNYRLFAKMAGVRNYNNVTPISGPKGLPENLTTLTKFDADYWEGDMHTASWLDANEIAEMSAFLDGLNTEKERYDLEWNVLHCYLFGNSFAGLDKYPEENQKCVTDVRFVFWFDN